MQDHYAVLGVDQDASIDEIEAAYRMRLEEARRDARNTGQPPEERIRKIQRAYAVLKDPDQRRRYHTQWSQERLHEEGAQDSPDIERYIEDQSSIYNERAIEFFQQKRLADAINEWRRAIEVAPDVAELHHNLGNAYARRGSLREAIDSWRRAVELDPGLAEAYNNLGYAHYKLDNFEEARLCWKQALRIDPGCDQARRNLQLLERRLRTTGTAMQRGEEEVASEERFETEDPHPRPRHRWWHSIRSKFDRRRSS